jgi:hypothetical protein
LKNGTAISEIQFAAGEAAASFSVAAAVDFAEADIFAIAAPDPQDATLADIALALVFGFTLISGIVEALSALVAPPPPRFIVCRLFILCKNVRDSLA